MRTDTFLCRNKENYKYINAELACSTKPIIKKHAYSELKLKIEDYIESKKKENKISSVGIYFRDLKDGPTLGINEHEKFIPASLLKTPLLIAYLQIAGQDPKILKERLTYQAEDQHLQDQVFIPEVTIDKNKSYTVEELLHSMIVYSDNRSYYTLEKYLRQIFPDRSIFRETLNNLGITTPRSNSDEIITVKLYASIFIQLYNSTFLEEEEWSEKALALLAEASFKPGIKSGIPNDVIVANKFGERTTSEGIHQLHDCGIVYYPQNPYLLCIMTRGQDFNNLSQVIGEVSKMFYEEIEDRRH